MTFKTSITTALTVIPFCFQLAVMAEPVKPVVASSDTSTETLPPVLAPERFFGAAAMGYSAAKANPQVCAKLFCYCGCDITDSHKRLLDCFTGTHGVDCHICQEEALTALRMHRDEEPLPNIQRTIDEMFASKYPFKEESPALKQYRASRLYTQAGGAGTTKSSISSAPGKACCPAKRSGQHHDCCSE